MANLMKAELYKLSHSRYFWGTGIFHFLLSSLLLLDSKGKTAGLFFASLYNIPLLYFLVIVFAALFVGNDLGGRTLHSHLWAGRKRAGVFFVKVIVYQAGCFAIFALPLFFHGLLGWLCMGETFAAIDGMFVTVVMTALSVTAMCVLPLFLAFLFCDTGRTLTVSMVLFFLMIFLMNGEQAQLMMRILPMGHLRLISLQQPGIADASFAAVDFLWSFLLYLGAGVLFCRADLK